MDAAREHGIVDALNIAGVPTVASAAYRAAAPAIRVRQRRSRLSPDTGRRRLSRAQKQISATRARTATCAARKTVAVDYTANYVFWGPK